MSDITYGGFFKSNIRRWLIKECLESGRADEFFEALREIVDEIDTERDEADFWEAQWEKVQ